jgi:hypothetical protein
MVFSLSNEARGRTVAECHRLSWEVRFACDNGHGGRIGADELPQRFPPETRLEDIAQRLVCSQCRSREGGLTIFQDNGAQARRDHARFKASGKYGRLSGGDDGR